MEKDKEKYRQARVKAAAASTSQLANEAVVTLVLNMEPYQFREIEHEFVKDLSALMGHEPSAIKILAVRSGCTETDIRIPIDGTDLIEILKSRGKNWPEDVLEFLTKYKVMPDPEAPNVIISRKNPKRSLTWLHLSDVHFEAPTSGTKKNYWSQDKVKESFIKQLPGILTKADLKPDFVFFTGDIASSGKKEEYDIANEFLSKLRHALPKRNDTRILLVPGNHDVDRDVVKRYPREEDFAKSFLKTNDSVFQYLHSPQHEPDRQRMLERQQNFFDFSLRCKPYGQPDLNHKYFFTSIFTHQDVKIGVAGLNSAWRASSDKDRYNLVLGVPQFDTAVRDLENTDLKLLLMHHPPDSDWFITPDMLYQRSNIEKFDFILRGHEHDPYSEMSPFKGKKQYFRISAGALYSSDFAKSFNAVKLDFDTGVGKVFFWRLSENLYKWIKDLEVTSEEEEVFFLSKSLRSRVRRRASSKKAGDSLPPA
ncbi:MAG TPA: metallophosphoesterase [Pyrinomonadaceae bacterium]